MKIPSQNWMFPFSKTYFYAMEIWKCGKREISFCIFPTRKCEEIQTQLVEVTLLGNKCSCQLFSLTSWFADVNTVLHLCMPERTEEQHMNTTYLGPFVTCCWEKFHIKIAYVLLMALLCYKADESFPCSSVYWAKKVQNSLWSSISSLWHSFVNWPPLDPVSGQKGYACSCPCSWGQFCPLFDLRHLNLHNIFDWCRLCFFSNMRFASSWSPLSYAAISYFILLKLMLT